MTFLGHRIFPGYRRLEAGNVKRFRRRLRRYDREVREGRRPVEQARACVQSWVAHAQHAKTFHLRQKMLVGVPWLYEVKGDRG